MKYYLIAGEASGDLHGSNLMKQLSLQDSEATFRCWGGDLMNAAGGTLVRHYKDLAFMGFVEVLLHLRTILHNLKQCKEDILQFHPDVIILIDYPGFNLRISEFASQAGFKVIYYISPQVWAWKKSRVKKIRKTVDKMLVILPFEKEFYSRYHYEVDFVGHPLLDVIRDHPSEKSAPVKKPLVAILPGSRKQEIHRVLPILLSLVPDFPDLEFVIAGAPGLEPSFYQELTDGGQVPVVFGKTYELLDLASAALVTSGTASLETALFNVPQVICYKGSCISFAIAKRLVKVRFIGLPNLIMDREIVRELIQSELSRENLRKELDSLLYDVSRRDKISADYQALHQILGGPGASAKAAGAILQYLNSAN